MPETVAPCQARMPPALHLLATLMFVLRDHEVRLTLQGQDSRQSIMSLMPQVESGLSTSDQRPTIPGHEGPTPSPWTRPNDASSSS